MEKDVDMSRNTYTCRNWTMRVKNRDNCVQDSHQSESATNETFREKNNDDFLFNTQEYIVRENECDSFVNTEKRRPIYRMSGVLLKPSRIKIKNYRDDRSNKLLMSKIRRNSQNLLSSLQVYEDTSFEHLLLRNLSFASTASSRTWNNQIETSKKDNSSLRNSPGSQKMSDRTSKNQKEAKKSFCEHLSALQMTVKNIGHELEKQEERIQIRLEEIKAQREAYQNAERERRIKKEQEELEKERVRQAELFLRMEREKQAKEEIGRKEKEKMFKQRLHVGVVKAEQERKDDISKIFAEEECNYEQQEHDKAREHEFNQKKRQEKQREHAETEMQSQLAKELLEREDVSKNERIVKECTQIEICEMENSVKGESNDDRIQTPQQRGKIIDDESHLVVFHIKEEERPGCLLDQEKLPTAGVVPGQSEKMVSHVQKEAASEASETIQLNRGVNGVALQQEKNQQPSYQSAADTRKFEKSSESIVIPPSSFYVQEGLLLIETSKKHILENLTSAPGFDEMATRKLRIEIKKEINMCLNQIASTSSQIIKCCKMLRSYFKALKEKYPGIVLQYALSQLVIRTLLLTEKGGQIYSSSSSVWSYAYVLRGVLDDFPLVLVSFKGLLFSKCCYAVPFYYIKKSDVDAREFMILKGQQPSESEDEYFLRMASCIRLYLALLVVREDHDEVWRWLARFLNLNSRKHFNFSETVDCNTSSQVLETCRIAPCLLNELLKIGGHCLCHQYGVQFQKIIKYVEETFIPRAAFFEGKNPEGVTSYIMQIKDFLKLCQDTSFHIPAPEGKQMKHREANPDPNI